MLDPTTDSGTYDNDDYTNFNNSTATNAPLIDVLGILPGATVVLKHNGVVVNQVVNTATTPGLYTIQVPDNNGGNGTIPDSPVGNPPDTAPPAGNPYDYTAYQIDAYGTQGAASTPPLLVIIDSTAPPRPHLHELEPVSDPAPVQQRQLHLRQ